MIRYVFVACLALFCLGFTSSMALVHAERLAFCQSPERQRLLGLAHNSITDQQDVELAEAVVSVIETCPKPSSNEKVVASELHYLKGDWKSAEKSAVEAVRLDPMNWRAFAARSHANWAQLKWARAHADLNRSIELNPHEESLHQQKIIMLQTMRGEESQSRRPASLSAE